jgi:hypothetical protein
MGRDAVRQGRQSKARFADLNRAPTWSSTLIPSSIARSNASTSTSGTAERAARRRPVQNRPRENLTSKRRAPFLGQGGARLQAAWIIKFSTTLLEAGHAELAMRGRPVLFLPEYCVSLAERLIPQPMSQPDLDCRL